MSPIYFLYLVSKYLQMDTYIILIDIVINVPVNNSFFLTMSATSKFKINQSASSDKKV